MKYKPCKLKITVLVLLLLFSCGDNPTSYSVKGTEINITNPVIPGFHPDPSVCRVGEDYYLVTSSFEYFPGIPIFHSKDMVNWQQIGHVLTRKSQLNLEGLGLWSGIYAPVIRYHDGIFYVTSTNVNGGGNFYVMATDPRGPWSEPIWVDEHWFDPSLFFDDDGKVYYLRRGDHGAVMAEIDINTGELLTELKTLKSGMVSSDMEGPHLYKINGMYYIMAAEGGTRAMHMETIARSKNIWGPYEANPQNPILAQHRGCYFIRGTGHGDLIHAHDGTWWMTFLATRHHGYDANSHLGRESFLTPITWEEGWPVVHPDAPFKPELTVQALPQRPWPEQPIRDDFDGVKLGFQWNFLRNPLEGSWSLQRRPGYLSLTGNPFTLKDIAAPAFVGRRQQHFNATATTKLYFYPTKNYEEAGITAFMNFEHHYAMLVRKKGNGREIIMRKVIGDMVCENVFANVPDGPVYLRIEATPRSYSFQWSVDGESFQQLDEARTTYIGPELASTFTGVFFAMYATGNGKPAKATADFKWFDYEPGEPLNEIKF
jgi:xylan 1,4-beta-xylosidase